MKKRLLSAFCALGLLCSGIASAEGNDIMTHYKGILCNQNFNTYEDGVPKGFMQQLTPAGTTTVSTVKTIGKDGTTAVKLTNQGCMYELIYAFDTQNMKAVEASFDICLSDFNSKKSFFIRNRDHGEMRLMSFCTDGTIELGKTRFKKDDFEFCVNEWYSVNIVYNLSNGYVRADISGGGAEATLHGKNHTNISGLYRAYFVCPRATNGDMTSISIDNLIVRGADPIFPTPAKDNRDVESFEDVENSPGSDWTVQYHNADKAQTSTYGVFNCEGEDGNGAALVSDGSMIELVKNYSTNTSYYISMSVYFADKVTKRIIASKGYPYSSTSISGEIPLITFMTNGKALVGNSSGAQFDYETGRWYDIKIEVNNVTGALNVTVNDGTSSAQYSGTMKTVIERNLRLYMYATGYSGTSRSEWRIDNFTHFGISEFRSSPRNGEEGIALDIGEINLEFYGNISETGPILLNGSVADIVETQIQGANIKVKITSLEPGKEYTLSFAGVKDNQSSYKNGHIRFKTADDIYISPLAYKNDSGNLDLPEASGFSTYFTGYAGSRENIIIYTALYSPDGKELLAVNLKNAVLTQYEKEYDIYMELPQNNGDFIYKTGVWTNEMKPIKAKLPTVYKRPDGAKVLSDIKEKIGTNVHPRLYVDEQELQKVKNRITRPGLYAASYTALINNADALLSKEPKAYEIPDGIRLLTVSREIRNRTETLGLAYALTQNEVYAKRLYEELENAASFPDWNPRHFLDTGEMLAAFAIGYDFAYDYIAKDTAKKDKIVTAVRDMGYEPLLDDYLNRPRTRTYKWTLTDEPDNWNVVCNGGGIMAAVAFADELPEYSEQIFNHALPLLEKAANRFAPDGAWFEGVSYWQYTIKYFTDILCSLNTAAGSDYGFSDIEGLNMTGYYPFAMHGEGGVFNFSNCGSGNVYASEVFYLANLFGDSNLQIMQYSFTQKLKRKLDFKGLLWYKGNYETEVENRQRDYYFRDTEVCSMRSSYDSTANFIAFCAGKNYVPHAHLDVGSFVLDMGGQRFACDLGNENYNLKTTYPWEPYRNRAEGHNTLVINPDINPDQNDKASTMINRFEAYASYSLAVCDMTAAYSDDVKSAIRGIRFLNNRQTVLLQDEIRCIDSSDIWWFMHTQATVTISADGKTATLQKGDVTINAKILTPSGTFRVMDAKPLKTSPQNSAQNANSAYRKLAIYFEDVKNLDIAVEFAPADFGGSSASVIPIAKW